MEYNIKRYIRQVSGRMLEKVIERINQYIDNLYGMGDKNYGYKRYNRTSK